jgi:hypothetical protein
MSSGSKRPELDVFVNDMGTISIRRAGRSAADESLIVIGAAEVSMLIGALDRARKKVLGSGVDDTDEITIPAIEYADGPLGST